MTPSEPYVRGCITSPGRGSLPSQSLLTELFYPPEYNPNFEARLDVIYAPMEAEMDKSEKLKEADWIANRRLIISSLGKHRRPIIEHTQESVDALDNFNCLLLEQIIEQRQERNVMYGMERIYCLEAGFDFDDLQWHKSVIDYCLQILPHPLNYIRNPDKEGPLSLYDRQSPNFYKRGENPPLHSEKKIREFDNRRHEAERLVALHFADYWNSWEWLINFSRGFVQTYPEVLDMRADINDRTVTKNRSNRRSKQWGNKLGVLCRCEFCYQFRIHPLVRGKNSIAWHCHTEENPSKECLKSYDAWQKELERQGVKLLAAL
jgi:hypothetical protein